MAMPTPWLWGVPPNLCHPPPPIPNTTQDSRLPSGGRKTLSGRMTVVSRSGGFSPRSAS